MGKSKTMLKKEQLKSKKLTRGDVTVKAGPLAGMIFTVETVIRVLKGVETLQYTAPSNGPSYVVVHYHLGENHKAEDVRLAFSRFFPPYIVYRNKQYWDTRTKTVLVWDKYLARFKPVEVEEKKEGPTESPE